MMNLKMLPCIAFSTLISLSWLLPLQASEQVPEPSATSQVNEDVDSTDESELDLFDKDTERTKQGWAQFYAAAGFMYLDGAGEFSVRLPDGNDVTIIDFDRAGLNDSDSSYWLSLNWRSAGSRWGMWFGSWQYDVTGSRNWQKSLPIGDTEIPVGASVTSSFDAKWYILEATYSFHRSTKIDTGIGLGVLTMDLDTQLSASFEVGDREVNVVTSQLDTLAPLPNVLVYFHWKFAPSWNLVTRLGYFDLTYGDYSGRMMNAHAMFNYQLSQRWALGLGYQFVDLDLEIEKANFTKVYDIRFAGPMAFARFSF